MYTKLRENESKYNTLYKLSTQRRYVIKEEDLVKGNETARISGAHVPVPFTYADITFIFEKK